MSLKLGSNQITPIQIKNIINNQSYKTIVPNQNTQIIAPDIVYKPFDNININLQENTTTSISYNSSNYFNLSIPKYVRLNGTMDIDWSSNNTNISTVISFSNCILTRGASYMGPDTGFRISSQQSGMSISGNINAWTGGPINRIEIFKAEGKIRLVIFFDSQLSTIYLSLINFTLELSDDITFSNNYDGMDQLTIQPIPSDYIIPEGTISISAPGTYDISSFASINIPGMSSPTWTTTRTSDAAKIVYSATITNGFNSKSQSFSSYTYFPAKSAATIIPSETSQTVVNQYNWTTGSIIVESIPASINIYEKIVNKTATGNELNEFFSTQSIISNYNFCWYFSGERLCSNIDFGTVSIIGSSAFASCYNIRGPVTGSNVIEIKASAFYNCTSITELNFPNVEIVEDYAFMYVSSVTTLSLPKVSSLGCQSYMQKLTTLNCSSLTTLRGYAFYGCSSLVNISLPELTLMSGYSQFTRCIELSIVYFPKLSLISGNGAFYSCYKLNTVNLPLLERISGANVFRSCSLLTNINIPICSSISSSTFFDCSGLQTISLPGLQYFWGFNHFYNCINLTSVYLMGSIIVSLQNSNTFSNTPMVNSTLTGTFGSIYVPSSLLATYKANNVWSWFTDRLTGI